MGSNPKKKKINTKTVAKSQLKIDSTSESHLSYYCQEIACINVVY